MIKDNYRLLWIILIKPKNEVSLRFMAYEMLIYCDNLKLIQILGSLFDVIGLFLEMKLLMTSIMLFIIAWIIGLESKSHYHGWVRKQNIFDLSFRCRTFPRYVITYFNISQWFDSQSMTEHFNFAISCSPVII